jgi:hypothetical protein
MEEKMTSATLSWLLEGPAWIRYRVRLDLVGQQETDPEVVADREEMLADPAVRSVIGGLGMWDGAVISSHKSAAQPYHLLTFLADLGLRAGDPGLEAVIGQVMSHQSAEGPFQLKANVSVAHGGAGRDVWGWALCDAPVVAYALAKLGLSEHAAVKKAADHVRSLVRDNGWPCSVSAELGGFRGPGRKDDPCPYATLVALRALTAFPGGTEVREAGIGAQTLLELWNCSRERHPYLFHMGTDFRKLKAPMVWYDLLHVLDVLSQIPSVRSDPRYTDLLAVLESKADGDDRFQAESIWKVWSGWEFGQKRAPSRWVTFLALRVIHRSGVL